MLAFFSLGSHDEKAKKMNEKEKCISMKLQKEREAKRQARQAEA
jgi:hypothetical protein